MRFMLMVKATAETEAGEKPSQELLEAMMRYNEELAKAGVLVAAEGLSSSAEGIRISYPEPGGKPQIMDGPFTEAKELIAGFTIIDVKSREEAVEWALRMPDPNGKGKGEIELRRIFEPSDLTHDPDIVNKENELRQADERARHS